jgi:hypothetical protein
MSDYSDEEELIVRKATFEAGKSKGIELGRKQGIIDELENLLEYSDWLQVSRDSTVTYYIIKRLKELKED